MTVGVVGPAPSPPAALRLVPRRPICGWRNLGPRRGRAHVAAGPPASYSVGPMPIRPDAVPDLGDYRAARQRRLSVTRALYGGDRARALLLPALVDLLALARADRAGVVWVDEHADEPRVHTYAVLDLGNDRPDLSFPWEPLAHAIELGVPGLVDGGGQGPATRRSRPLVAVALGSDWVRAWFLVADGGTPRPWLSATERERVQHIAGLVCAIVLHRDMEPQTVIRGMSPPSGRESSYTGQGVLEDLADGSLSEEEEELIVSRFFVARLIGQVVEDGGVFSPRLEHQISGVHREWAESDDEPSERPAWEAVLQALEAEDLPALGKATVALARHAEAAGHNWSCAQLSSWAYDLALASGSPATAAAAAKAMAAACAEVSDSDAANHWARARRSLMSALEDAPGASV